MARKKRRIIVYSLLGVALVVIGGFALRGLRQSQIASNERSVSAALKTLASAEADFRANDRDGNGVNDFWTGDVAGLFNLVIQGRELQLIARELAEADADPLRPMVKAPRPYRGYYFAALETDESDPVRAERFYGQDTGGSPARGKVHHHSKFGFVAYPAEPGVTGGFDYLLNEGNTIIRFPATGKRPRQWPSHEQLKGLFTGRWSGGDD